MEQDRQVDSLKEGGKDRLNKRGTGLRCPQGVSRNRGDCSRQPNGPQQAL